MKVVILAGGLGTRLSEETIVRPKPMVEIGGKPIIDHIMRWYAHHGFNEFMVALGYKGEQIKSYFLNYYALNSDITVSLKNGNSMMTKDTGEHDDWLVHLVDTGLHTQTGGRLRRLKSRLMADDDSTFLMTYGDGLANIDINKLVQFHQAHGKLATMTAVRPPSRFGGLALDGDRITQFIEKPPLGEGWINGGYFVLNRRVLDYIVDDSTSWERSPLEQLVRDGELMAFKHEGFWQAMDNVREKQMLEEIWQNGDAPWQVSRG